MNNLKRFYFFAFIIFYISIFLLKYYDINQVSKYIIPFFVFTVFAYSLTSAIKQGGSYLLPLGLFFCVIGDTLINLTSIGSLSVLAFSLTHTCLIIFYFSIKKFEKSDILVLLAVFLLSAIIYVTIFGDIKTKLEQIVFTCYLCVLTIMLWRAFCTLKSGISKKNKIFIVVGSTLFFATDVLVCLQEIYDYKIFETLTWVFYQPALYLLSIIEIKSPENELEIPN